MPYSLCESEYRFACLVWENEPISSGELAKLCLAKLGWKKSTTYTVLKKLCERGILQNQNAQVTALVKREQIQKEQSEQFVGRTFGGSLPQFLAAFMQGKQLNDQQADELLRLIEQHRKGE